MSYTIHTSSLSRVLHSPFHLPIFVTILMNWGATLFYCFIIVTSTQIFYYVFFFSRLAFYKPKDQKRTQEHPVSVIICARDEDENLARNLPGVLVQDYATTHEVIVVNDNSADDSKYILAELQKTLIADEQLLPMPFLLL